MHGAHGGEIRDIVYSVIFLDEKGNINRINNEKCEFGYRTSLFAKNKKYIIVEAEFKLKNEDKEVIRNRMNENLTIRGEKQPLNYPSAGSVFKRGENYIAAKLIDECGLKGLAIGDACISEKHAGFIINKGNATAKDVLELINIIKQKVYDKFNVKIETEIEILGEE